MRCHMPFWKAHSPSSSSQLKSCLALVEPAATQAALHSSASSARVSHVLQAPKYPCAGLQNTGHLRPPMLLWHARGLVMMFVYLTSLMLHYTVYSLYDYTSCSCRYQRCRTGNGHPSLPASYLGLTTSGYVPDARLALGESRYRTARLREAQSLGIGPERAHGPGPLLYSQPQPSKKSCGTRDSPPWEEPESLYIKATHSHSSHSWPGLGPGLSGKKPRLQCLRLVKDRPPG